MQMQPSRQNFVQLHVSKLAATIYPFSKHVFISFPGDVKTVFCIVPPFDRDVDYFNNLRGAVGDLYRSLCQFPLIYVYSLVLAGERMSAPSGSLYMEDLLHPTEDVETKRNRLCERYPANTSTTSIFGQQRKDRYHEIMSLSSSTISYRDVPIILEFHPDPIQPVLQILQMLKDNNAELGRYGKNVLDACCIHVLHTPNHFELIEKIETMFPHLSPVHVDIKDYQFVRNMFK